MKTGVRSITYAVAEPRTYLVIGLESGVEPVEFCVRMAERIALQSDSGRNSAQQQGQSAEQSEGMFFHGGPPFVKVMSF